MNRKTENSPDPLDNKIDGLVARQPIQPSAGFVDRVLAAIDKPANSKDTERTINPWLRAALPIAALLIAAFVIVHLTMSKPANAASQTLSTIELEEIFILEEGLGGLTSVQDEDLRAADLLKTLISLNSENQS